MKVLKPIRNALSRWAVLVYLPVLAFNISPASGQTAHILSNNAARSAYDTYAASSPVAENQVTAAQRMFADGEYKKAAHRLEAALKLETHNSGLLDELGVIYERLAEGSAFPSFDQHRAESMFRQSMATDGNDPRPLQHLISMLLDPPNGCRMDLREVPKLIQRLALIDPVEAREASQNLEWASSEPTSLAERVSCAPHEAVAIVHRMVPK